MRGVKSCSDFISHLYPTMYRIFGCQSLQTLTLVGSFDANRRGYTTNRTGKPGENIGDACRDSPRSILSCLRSAAAESVRVLLASLAKEPFLAGGPHRMRGCLLHVEDPPVPDRRTQEELRVSRCCCVRSCCDSRAHLPMRGPSSAAIALAVRVCSGCGCPQWRGVTSPGWLDCVRSPAGPIHTHQAPSWSRDASNACPFLVAATRSWS